MPFDKAIRKLIRAQGPKGLTLLQILDNVEMYGSRPYDDNKLEALAQQCPRACEYNTGIIAALETYTSDIAEGMTKYGVCNAFDAWRRLYNHYVPLAEDLQHILIQALYDIKQVNEQDIDKLFNDVQRIVEL